MGGSEGLPASLVLLDQQPQGFRLSESHVGVHAEVVGTAPVLPAQVPAGWGTGLSFLHWSCPSEVQLGDLAQKPYKCMFFLFIWPRAQQTGLWSKSSPLSGIAQLVS